MATYSADEIYLYARAAGFSPDQAVTMTAIALAESGGRTEAHNTVGEDSRGLWQVNMDAHPQYANRDISDPMVNAEMAYAVSQQGADISPWTVTHQVSGSRYLQFKGEAQAAAVAAGDPSGLGQWNPPQGYGDHVSAGDAGMAGTPLDVELLASRGSELSSSDGPSIHEFIEYAQAQAGDTYILGAEASPDEVDPDAFDCSELVEWAAARAGVYMPDYAWNQYNHLKDKGTLIPVEEAVDTPGALLFYFGSDPDSGDPPSQHVAISLGNGQTIEARGSAYGVNNFEAEGRFTHAAVIPDFSLGEPGASLDDLAPDLGGEDADQDGLAVGLEELVGTSDSASDSDRDGMSDMYELTRTGTDPRLADTDQDGVSDSIEIALGADPKMAESHDEMAVDQPVPATDADADGLDDAIEETLSTSVELADTDSDGFSDFAEQSSGSDPTDPFSTPVVADLPGVEFPQPAEDESEEDEEEDELPDLADLDD